jgi:tRNA (guanine37-N1)-methyltransferase
VVEDSFSRGLLDFPQYTRPAELRTKSSDGCVNGGGETDLEVSLRVPDVLLSGNHAEIRRWRKREALVRTRTNRPDLLASADLDEEEREILKELED